MGTWKEHINALRAEFVGKRVMYQGNPFNIVDVDYNGIIHIDLESEHNKTTAVYDPHEARKHLLKRVYPRL